jgi:hypothetical protein
MRWREMSFHELYRYFLTVPILRVCPVDSECCPKFRVRILGPVAEGLWRAGDLEAVKENGRTARGDRPNSPTPAMHVCALSNLCDDFCDEQEYKACAQRKQPDQPGKWQRAGRVRQRLSDFCLLGGRCRHGRRCRRLLRRGLDDFGYGGHFTSWSDRFELHFFQNFRGRYCIRIDRHG